MDKNNVHPNEAVTAKLTFNPPGIIEEGKLSLESPITGKLIPVNMVMDK